MRPGDQPVQRSRRQRRSRGHAAQLRGRPTVESVAAQCSSRGLCRYRNTRRRRARRPCRVSSTPGGSLFSVWCRRPRRNGPRLRRSPPPRRPSPTGSASRGQCWVRASGSARPAGWLVPRRPGPGGHRTVPARRDVDRRRRECDLAPYTANILGRRTSAGRGRSSRSHPESRARSYGRAPTAGRSSSNMTGCGTPPHRHRRSVGRLR